MDAALDKLRGGRREGGGGRVPRDAASGGSGGRRSAAPTRTCRARSSKRRWRSRSASSACCSSATWASSAPWATRRRSSVSSGTVWGIMRAFHDMAATGSAGPSVVAAGVAEALFTTAAGLLVAVPAVILYNHFMRKTSVMLTQAENHARTTPLRHRSAGPSGSAARGSRAYAQSEREARHMAHTIETNCRESGPRRDLRGQHDPAHRRLAGARRHPAWWRCRWPSSRASGCGTRRRAAAGAPTGAVRARRGGGRVRGQRSR